MVFGGGIESLRLNTQLVLENKDSLHSLQELYQTSGLNKMLRIQLLLVLVMHGLVCVPTACMSGI